MIDDADILALWTFITCGFVLIRPPRRSSGSSRIELERPGSQRDDAGIHVRATAVNNRTTNHLPRPRNLSSAKKNLDVQVRTYASSEKVFHWITALPAAGVMISGILGSVWHRVFLPDRTMFILFLVHAALGLMLAVLPALVWLLAPGSTLAGSLYAIFRVRARDIKGLFTDLMPGIDSPAVGRFAPWQKIHAWIVFISIGVLLITGAGLTFYASGVRWLSDRGNNYSPVYSSLYICRSRESQENVPGSTLGCGRFWCDAGSFLLYLRTQFAELELCPMIPSWRFEFMSNSVLVVDANQQLNAEVSSILSRRSLETRVAESVSAAIRELVKSQPGLILIELNLPKRSGFELLAHLSNPQFASMYKIAMTENPSSQIVQDAISQGANAFLVKPFSSTDLLHRVTTGLRSAA
jgi:CheY-like chemotaxis protein/cytochrome b subunit of formate dehydrogenase